MRRAIFLVLLLMGGCIFAPDREEGQPSDLLRTPQGVIRQLEDAYRRKDLERYLECLADTFEFHLVPREVNDIWPAPSWGKVEEERMHRNMFGRMDHIELTLSGDHAQLVVAEPETWRLFREFDLLVWKTADELFERGVGYGWAEFVVQKDASGRFRIVDWYDLEQAP